MTPTLMIWPWPISEDIVRAGGADLLEELTEALTRYRDASTQEDEWTAQGTIPPLDVYLDNRAGRITTEVFVVLQRLQPDLRLPEAPTPLLTTMSRMTAAVCGVENDLVSYHRDVNEACRNLITVLRERHGLSLREAFASGLAIYAALKAQLEMLITRAVGESERQQAEALLSWVAASRYFHDIPRYADN